jgi:hypothetical protein
MAEPQAKQYAEMIASLVERYGDRIVTRMFKRGYVTAVNGLYSDVQIEGNENTTLRVPSLGSYNPAVGDNVLVLSAGTTGANLVIVGRIGGTEASQKPIQLWRYFNNPATGVVIAGNTDATVAMNAFAEQKGIDFDGTDAIIKTPGLYTLYSKVMVIDVASGVRGYFDVFYPAGYLGSTTAFSASEMYDNNDVTTVAVGNWRTNTVTLYLPAGTKLRHRVTVRGSQTRIGGTGGGRAELGTHFKIIKVSS